MTDELTLREVAYGDLPTFFEQQSDPEANRMAAFTAEDPSDRDAFMSHWARILVDDAITAKTIVAGDRVVGHVAGFERFGKPEVTYWIGREHWGRGIATVALRQFLEIVDTRPLYARAARDNLASIRVLEKCGFSICGYERAYANARSEEIEEAILVLHGCPNSSHVEGERR